MDYSTPDLTAKQLETLRSEYLDISAQFAEKAKLLEPHIRAAEKKMQLAEMDTALKAISPGGAEGVSSREIVFLINRSEDMGKGFSSFIGRAVTAAGDLKSAVEGLTEIRKGADGKGAEVNVCSDVKVRGGFWGSGSSVAIKFGDIGSLSELVDKTAKGDARDLLTVAKEVLKSNTPDLAGLPRHYVIFTPGLLPGDTAAIGNIFEAACQLNPKMTLDFVICGEARGNTPGSTLDMTSHVVKANKHILEKPEDAVRVIAQVLAVRVAQMPAPARAAETGKKEEIQVVANPTPEASVAAPVAVPAIK